MYFPCTFVILYIHLSLYTGTGVMCNSVHPGLVNTEIGRHMGVYKSWIALIFLRPLLWLFLKTPRQGAQTTLYAALSPDLEGVSGKYFRLVRKGGFDIIYFSSAGEFVSKAGQSHHFLAQIQTTTLFS